MIANAKIGNQGSRRDKLIELSCICHKRELSPSDRVVKWEKDKRNRRLGSKKKAFRGQITI
jgi:hypothetical protein